MLQKYHCVPKVASLEAREKYYQALNGSADQNRQVGTNVDEPSDNDMPTFNRYYNR